MDTRIQRIDNILYGGEVDISLNNMSLGRTIFEKMKKYGKRILQIDPDTNDRETYEEVNIKSVRLALTLRNHGVKNGDVILICSENSMESLVLTCGTLYLNAIAVTLDPHISLIDAVHLLSVVSPKMIIVIENSLELIEKSLAQLDIATRIAVIGTHMKYQTLNGFLRPHPHEQTFIPECVKSLQNTAMIFFSSGATGLPKAVCYSHEAILKSCIGLSMDIIDCTTCLHYTSPHHIAAFLFSTAEILVGGKKIISKTFTPEKFLKYVEDYKVTFSVLIPSYCTQFNEETARNYKTDGLTEMRICGRIAAAEQMKTLLRCFPETKIYTLYGQTEAGVISMFSKSSDFLSRTKFDSCGVPFISTMIKIVDVETEYSLGPYEKGEIRLINETGFSCYYKERQHQNSFDKDGFLKTGDIGYYDEDNCLYFSGRLRESFKYRNWCIVPACIEAAIYKHPAVSEAIVIGMPHAVDQHHPFALVVLKEDSDVSEAELLSFVNALVSDKEKLRAGVKIVKELPKTCTGKIPRQVVRQMLLTGNFNRYFM